MAVDENGIEIPDVAENSRQSVKFIVNNREYGTAEEAEAALREMESSIKSAYDRKLAEERQKLQSEKSALAEDVEWYATHDVSLWNQYEEKVHGGKGFVGIVTEKSKTTTVPDNAAFNDANAINRLEERLRSMETELTSLKQYDDEKAKGAVIATLKNNLAKYPYADEQAVKLELENYYRANNQHHPTPDIVLQVIEKSNKRTLDLVNKAKSGKPDVPAPPVVTAGGSGTPAADTAKGRPSLSKDPEGFKRWIADKAQQSVEFAKGL